jgi:predicted dehydrogenase
VRLVAVADANEALAADTARRYGYQRSESTWQAVAAADDVDVVSVVLANPLHREVVEGLLAAGKHVLCEKPLAPTVEDAEAMVAAARPPSTSGRGRLHVPPLAGHRGGPRPGRPGRSGPGPLRRPLLVRLRASTRRPDELALQGRPGSGALADIGSHLVDLAEFLCGPVESVRGACCPPSSTSGACRRVPSSARARPS